MLIQSKINTKPFICNEAVRVMDQGKKISWIVESTTKANIYFIYRKWSPKDVIVEIYKNNIRPSVPLTIVEENWFNKNIIKKSF